MAKKLVAYRIDPGVVDLMDDTRKEMNIDALKEEIVGFCQKEDWDRVWDLSNHSIEPELFRAIFTMLDETAEVTGNFCIDFTANNLYSVSEDDFMYPVLVSRTKHIRFFCAESVKSLCRAYGRLHMRNIP